MTGCGCGIKGMTGGKRKGGAGDQAAQAAQATAPTATAVPIPTAVIAVSAFSNDC